MPSLVSSISNNLDLIQAKNVDFSGQSEPADTIVSNSQLLIGSTALNAGGTHINVGTLTSPNNSITFGYSSPNITAVVNTASLTDLHVAKWIVNSSGGTAGGNQTTIQNAINAAVSGDTIFVMPGSTGTYTENLTLKAGVNIVAFNGDQTTPHVTIIGNATLTTAGTVTLSNLRLQTNSAACLTVSGSAASVVNLDNCFINASNATGITFSSSSASAQINMIYCQGNIGTTGIALFANSSAGTMMINNSNFTNSGASTTASTVSAGTLNVQQCFFFSPITTSSTAAISGSYYFIDTSAINAICLTVNGTGSSPANYCLFSSGTASAVSIGTGATLFAKFCFFSSNNANAVTGAGTFSSDLCQISGAINATTTIWQYQSGSVTNAAPGAGKIGERITNSATGVSINTAADTTITSINLTPGIWDVTGSIGFVPAGGTTLGSLFRGGISVTTNSISGGTSGIDFNQWQTAAISTSNGCAISVPEKRITLSATTTYYLVGFVVFSATTCTANAVIGATRVA